MKLFNCKSIQTKLIISIIIFMVIPMTVLWFFISFNTENIIGKKVEDLTWSTLEQMNANFQQVIDNMLAISNIVDMDQDFTKLLDVQEEKSTYEEYLRRQKVVDKLTSYLGVLLRYNCQIAFIDNNNVFYTTWNRSSDFEINNDIINSDWYKDTIKSNSKICWVINHKSYIPEEKHKGKFLFTMSRLVKGERSFGRYGVLVVSIYIDELEYYLNQNVNSKKEGFLIVNQAGDIVIKTDFFVKEGMTDLDWCFDKMKDQNVGSFIENFQNKKMLVQFKKLKSADLKTVYITPDSDINKEVRDLQGKNILINIALILAFILVTVFISYTISKPIKLLTRHMSKVREGNLDEQVSVNTRDEVGLLTENFNTMLKDLKGLMRQIQQKEKEKKEAHLAALQAQINPHFLFNTLNAIKWASYMNGVPNIGNKVAALGRLFEIVINKESEFITIKEEMEYLDNYIVLMEFKHNQEITVEYHVSETIKTLYTLKFILQPIVENSIIHGLSEVMSGGKLAISAETEDQKVIFKIADNGKGMTEETIKALLQSETNYDRRRFTGIGISNVNERIKLNFGNEYGIEITSKVNLGTTVSVKIPILDKISEEAVEKND